MVRQPDARTLPPKPSPRKTKKGAVSRAPAYSAVLSFFFLKMISLENT